MLINPNAGDEAVASQVKNFLHKNHHRLNAAHLNRAVVSEITKGNGILTPKIILAKLINDMKATSGDIDSTLVKQFTSDCKKTVDFYDQCTAMSLYAKSVVNMKIMEAAARKELTKLEHCRNILDASTDFLMSFVPFYLHVCSS